MFAALATAGVASLLVCPVVTSATAAPVHATAAPPAISLPNGPVVPASGTSLLGAMLVKGSPRSESAEWNSLEASSGGNVDLAHIIYTWGSTIPTWREGYALQHHRTPMVSWGGVTTTDVTSGRYDSYIRTTAIALHALGGHVMLRWFWEMDGKTFAPLAVSPAAFKAAWAHIHAIFAAVGASNVVWVWSPTAYGFDVNRAQQFYPGDALVDWVAADGFNPYPGVPGSSPKSFASIFASFYRWGTSVNKPLMVAATGAMESSDPMGKANWIRDMARTVATIDPGIRAICYLNKASGWYTDPSLTLHWELKTSANALQAWGAIAAQPTFANAR